MMSDLGKFWNEIEGLPKEERSKRIQEEYGGNPEILEILKEILANKDDHHDNLKNVLDNWRQVRQVNLFGPSIHCYYRIVIFCRLQVKVASIGKQKKYLHQTIEVPMHAMFKPVQVC